MRTIDHRPLLTRGPGLTMRLLVDPEDARAAVEMLDHAERVAGVDLVDEAERERLRRAADSDRQRHHHGLVACAGDSFHGYAGIVIEQGVVHGVGDVAVSPDVDDPQPVLLSLLAAVDEVVSSHRAHGTELWKRRATPDDVTTAVAAGYAVHRRLQVLGRRLDDVSDLEAPTGRTRSMTADDVDGVVAVLRAAYGDGDDGGWTRDRFLERSRLPWFEWEDVLVEDVDGRVLGVHWTKRRGGGVGEVYNLAVHPDAQGQRLGHDLLIDGLHHLRSVGCSDVMLWVDLVNEAALRLYVGHGFRSRWEDVALRRHTRHSMHAPGESDI